MPTLNNPSRQQSVAAVAVIREEVGGLWTARGVSGRRRRTGGWWCIILYINGRKSPRWHVGGLNQAANIDGSDLPLLTRPFLILVPNQVYLGLFGFYAPIQVHVPAWHVVCTHAFVPRQCKTLLQFFPGSSSGSRSIGEASLAAARTSTYDLVDLRAKACTFLKETPDRVSTASSF